MGRRLAGMTNVRLAVMSVAIQNPRLNCWPVFIITGTLEVLFGSGSSPLLDETLEYLTVHHSERVVSEQVAETLLQLLRRDRETTARMLHELGLPTRTLPTSQKALLEQLVRLTTLGGAPKEE